MKVPHFLRTSTDFGVIFFISAGALRRPHFHRANPFPIQPFNQRHDLRVTQTDLVASRRSASKNASVPDACTSHENAAAPSTTEHLVRVTHPFHPLFAQHLPCVGKRYNRYGERLLLQARNGAVWSVPPGWTDVVSPDPNVVMGHGRSLLAGLRFDGACRSGWPPQWQIGRGGHGVVCKCKLCRTCKANYAAIFLWTWLS